MLGSAAAGLGVHQLAEPVGRVEGVQVGGGSRVTDREAVIVEGGLGEQAGQFHLPGAGLAVLGLAFAALGVAGGTIGTPVPSTAM